jgi:purine-binding chemotaxis protein CheW
MAEAAPSAPSQIVVFRLGDEEYGVPIENVEGIIRREPPTPVPYAPPSMEGVINLRGRIVPVVDLASRFDLEPREPTDKSRIVIANLQEQFVGLAVDAATEVLTLPAGAVEPPPDVVSSTAMKDAIVGVARVDDRLIVLLRLDNVIPSIEDLAAAATEESET